MRVLASIGTSGIARVVAAVLWVSLLAHPGAAISTCGAAGDCPSRCGAHVATARAPDCCESAARPELEEAVSPRPDCRCTVQSRPAGTPALTSANEPQTVSQPDASLAWPPSVRGDEARVLGPRRWRPPDPTSTPLYLATSALLI